MSSKHITNHRQPRNAFGTEGQRNRETEKQRPILGNYVPEALCSSVPVVLCLSVPLSQWDGESEIPITEEVDRVIDECLPESVSQLQPSIYRLLRIIKTEIERHEIHGRTVPSAGELHPRILRDIVSKWADSAAAILGENKQGRPFVTQTMAKGWFAEAWPKIKHQLGEGPIDLALREGRGVPIDDRYRDELDAENIRRLCIGLDRLHRDEQGCIRLTYRAAGEAIGVDKNRIGTLIKCLISDDVLELVELGDCGRASRYRFIENIGEITNDPGDDAEWPRIDNDE